MARPNRGAGQPPQPATTALVPMDCAFALMVLNMYGDKPAAALDEGQRAYLAEALRHRDQCNKADCEAKGYTIPRPATPPPAAPAATPAASAPTQAQPAQAATSTPSADPAPAPPTDTAAPNAHPAPEASTTTSSWWDDLKEGIAEAFRGK